jgi:uncharacterized protein YndB with AHSA1/START domain
MTGLATLDAFGTRTEPTTLTIQRLLPGPIERVWAYLTDSDMRRKWLASGDMEMKAGTSFELTWRNDELTTPPGKRPDGFGAEHSMTCRMIACDPPRRLAFTFGQSGEVTFDLAEQGGKVLLTVTHSRLPDRNVMLMVGPGWHMHLDILVARATGTEPEPFWDGWTRLKAEYEKRLAA